jgi:hypothetical protein
MIPKIHKKSSTVLFLHDVEIYSNQIISSFTLLSDLFYVFFFKFFALSCKTWFLHLRSSHRQRSRILVWHSSLFEHTSIRGLSKRETIFSIKHFHLLLIFSSGCFIERASRIFSFHFAFYLLLLSSKVVTSFPWEKYLFPLTLAPTSPAYKKEKFLRFSKGCTVPHLMSLSSQVDMHLFKFKQNYITSFSKQNDDSWPFWSAQFIFS